LAGFTSGEGCFLINNFKARTKIGEAVKLVFVITQHSRDEKLFLTFPDILLCGGVKLREGGGTNVDALDFKVTKIEDIQLKIIPFFKKFPILGVKAKDFADWCKVAELMKKKDAFN